jgi:hypothetical protein
MISLLINICKPAKESMPAKRKNKKGSREIKESVKSKAKIGLGFTPRKALLRTFRLTPCRPPAFPFLTKKCLLPTMNHPQTEVVNTTGSGWSGFVHDSRNYLGSEIWPSGKKTIHLCIDMQLMFAFDDKVGIRSDLEGLARGRSAVQPICSNMKPQMMDLLPELKRFSPPVVIVDRKVFSVFASLDLRELLAQRSIDTLVVSGFETDVCVLATILAAIDRGFRVVVVKDAVASSNADGEKPF